MEDFWSLGYYLMLDGGSLATVRFYAYKITLDELAERYFINKFYLTRIFKQQYGMSISAYLQSIRITHAKQALRFTQKSIDEIAAETGFTAGYYLSRIFRKVEGISPSEYRAEWG